MMPDEPPPRPTCRTCLFYETAEPDNPDYVGYCIFLPPPCVPVSGEHLTYPMMAFPRIHSSNGCGQHSDIQPWLASMRARARTDNVEFIAPTITATIDLDVIQRSHLPLVPFKVLRRIGVLRWSQLVHVTGNELLAEHGLGTAGLHSICESLAARGLHLANEN